MKTAGSRTDEHTSSLSGSETVKTPTDCMRPQSHRGNPERKCSASTARFVQSAQLVRQNALPASLGLNGRSIKRFTIPPESDGARRGSCNVLGYRVDMGHPPLQISETEESSMKAHDGMLVRVLSEWNGWRTTEVQLRDLQRVHWLQPSHAPHPLLHGYISCTNVVNGNIPHECDTKSAPHRLLVCVLKTHNIPTAYAELARRANEERTCPLSGGAVRPTRPGSAA